MNRELGWGAEHVTVEYPHKPAFLRTPVWRPGIAAKFKQLLTSYFQHAHFNFTSWVAFQKQGPVGSQSLFFTTILPRRNEIPRPQSLNFNKTNQPQQSSLREVPRAPTALENGFGDPCELSSRTWHTQAAIHWPPFPSDVLKPGCRHTIGVGASKFLGDFCLNFPKLPRKVVLRLLPSKFLPQRSWRSFLVWPLK